MAPGFWNRNMTATKEAPKKINSVRILVLLIFPIIFIYFDTDLLYSSSIGRFDPENKIPVFDYLVLLWNFTGQFKNKSG